MWFLFLFCLGFSSWIFVFVSHINSRKFWAINSLKMTNMVDLLFLSSVSLNTSFLYSPLFYPFWCILSNTLRHSFHLLIFSLAQFYLSFEFLISKVLFFLSLILYPFYLLSFPYPLKVLFILLKCVWFMNILNIFYILCPITQYLKSLGF